MSTVLPPGSRATLIPEERRHPGSEPPQGPLRRLNDSWFNRIRWPAFIGAWFVFGLAVFALLLWAWLGR